MRGAACLTSSKGDIGPNFAVHVLKRRVNHGQMTISELRLRHRRLKGFHFTRRWIESNNLHLGHVAVVNPSFPIDIDLKTPLSDLTETVLGDGTRAHLARSSIQLPNKLRIEIGIREVTVSG